jgi:hypothetical protein
MTMRLFPISLPDWQAAKLAETTSDFNLALENEGRFTRITSLTVYGDVSKDRTLNLSAWASTDNGFCLSGGVFWKHTEVLSEERFARLIDQEILRRAEQEINDEETRKLNARIEARAAKIRATLLMEIKA